MSFNAARVSREDLVEWSVFKYVTEGIQRRGILIPEHVTLLESFNTNIFDGEIDKTYLAPGFHMNDGGRLFELGSNMRTKAYTFEYWIIGKDATQGRNLANIVAEIVETDLVIPVLDFTQPGNPVIDALLADEEPSKVERAVVGDPQPWQQHLYCCHVKVVDQYYSSTATSVDVESDEHLDGGAP